MKYRDFYKKLKKYFHRRYQKYLDLRGRKKIEENKDLLKTLQKYIKQSSSTGCSYSDYWELYNYVRTKKPLEILECGTGVSTVVMAHALMENEKETGARGRITSMEEIEKWHKVACALFPAHLKKYADIVLSLTVEDNHALFRGVRYAHIPKRQYEFVFIDGPKARSPVDGTKTFDIDFIRIVGQSDISVYGMIDMRLSTYYVLREVFGRHKVTYNKGLSLGFVGPCTKHDIRFTNEITLDYFERTLK